MTGRMFIVCAWGAGTSLREELDDVANDNRGGKPSTGTPKDKRLSSTPGHQKPGPKPGGKK